MPWSDYNKRKEIGAGSFGRAYLVEVNASAKLAHKKLLVMKEIDLSKMDGQGRRNAEVEVQVLSSLKHPYIVRYSESFVHAHNLCIIMDYCEGGDLWQLIAQRKRQRAQISEAQVLRWFTQMSLALKHMHDKNVLHRDIKSQNVFLAQRESQSCGPGIVKIADFGIAKVLDSDKALARTQVGTPYYLSPEICQKQPYSSPSDVWALGCVLYELCALHVPFEAQDILQLVDKIVRSPVSRLPSPYSSELGNIVSDMLNKDSRRRPSAEMVLQKKVLQDEIKHMLEENRTSKGGENGAEERRESAREPGSARGHSHPPRGVLQEHNHNPPASQRRSASKPGSRAPSPVHQEAAKQLLRAHQAAHHMAHHENQPLSARHDYPRRR